MLSAGAKGPESSPGDAALFQAAPAYASICAALHRRVHEAPDATAYRFLRDGEDEYLHLSYSQLGARVAATAAELRALGQPGARVLLLHPSGPDFVVAFLACATAGMIAVPAYPPRPNRKAERLKLIIADAQASFVMAPAGYHAQISAVAPADITFVDVRAASADFTLEDFELPDAEATLYLQYTSGSTSAPKGVVISHANLVWTLEDMHRGWGHTADSVIFSWLPVFHDMGLIYGVLAALYLGIPCVLMHHADFLQRPLRWLKAMQHYRATHCCAPNFAYALCTKRISAEAAQELDLSSWKVAVNGSEPIDVVTLREFSEHFAPSGFLASAFSPGYGLAEATLKVTALDHAAPATVLHLDASALEDNRLEIVAEFDPRGRAIVGCGTTHIGTEIKIVDPQSHKDIGQSTLGEIWVRGPIVAQAYWQNSSASRESFDAALCSSTASNSRPTTCEPSTNNNGQAHLNGHSTDVARTTDLSTGQAGGWMRTGDLGFLHEGELFIAGRLKDMLIIRGRNLYPQDIERCAAAAHRALNRDACAAFALQHAGQETLGLALEVERSAIRHISAAELRASVAAAVAAEFDIQPHAIALLRPNALPKTSSGKLQRSATRTAYLQDTLRNVDELLQGTPPDSTAELTAASADLQAAESQSPADEMNTQNHAEDLAAKNSSAHDPLAWILEWIKCELRTEAGRTDNVNIVKCSWQQIGLDSLTSQRLIGDAQVEFAVRLSTDAAWEYSSPAALAEYIAQNMQQARTAAGSTDALPDLAELSPDDINNLSDAQIDGLLAKMLQVRDR